MQACSTQVTLFYFKPKSKRFAFDKHPLGIKTLNYILPWPYKEESVKRKTAVYTAYVVEEGLIGHFRITFGLFFKASPGAHLFI